MVGLAAPGNYPSTRSEPRPWPTFGRLVVAPGERALGGSPPGTSIERGALDIPCTFLVYDKALPHGGGVMRFGIFVAYGALAAATVLGEVDKARDDTPGTHPLVANRAGMALGISSNTTVDMVIQPRLPGVDHKLLEDGSRTSAMTGTLLPGTIVIPSSWRVL